MNDLTRTLEYGVRRSPGLESSGLLEILALEEQFSTGEIVDRPACLHGRDVSVVFDPFRGLKKTNVAMVR